MVAFAFRNHTTKGGVESERDRRQNHDAEKPIDIAHPKRRGRLDLDEGFPTFGANERLTIFDLCFLPAIGEQAT
jgi:hypothetical protein